MVLALPLSSSFLVILKTTCYYCTICFSAPAKQDEGVRETNSSCNIMAHPGAVHMKTYLALDVFNACIVHLMQKNWMYRGQGWGLPWWSHFPFPFMAQSYLHSSFDAAVATRHFELECADVCVCHGCFFKIRELFFNFWSALQLNQIQRVG